MTQGTPKSAGTPPEAPGHPAKPSSEREYWLDQSKNVDKVFYGTCLLCALVAAADLLVHRHLIFSVEALFAFYGLYGFVACVGLVLAAKELRKIIKRDEAYYGDDR